MSSKVILVDNITKSKINHNPSGPTNNLEIKNLEIKVAAELDEKGDYYIKPYSGNNEGKTISFTEYTKSKEKTFVQCIEPSRLYTNVYFEADNFDEQYQKEYKKILYDFVTKLGGDSWAKHFDTEEERNECIKQANTTASLLVKGNRNSQTKTLSQERKSEKHFTRSSGQKCSQEEIDQWIKQEKINLDALPGLGPKIKKFLEKGELKDKFSWNLEMVKIEVKDETNNFKAKTPLFRKLISFKNIFTKPPFCPLKDIYIDFKSLQKKLMEKQMKKKLYVCAEFKHDGIES